MKKTKQKIDVRKLNLAGLFIALGVIIPYFAGHAFGVPGVVLLPMHIPVLMAGLLLGWRYGVLVGILAPILSSLLTGMPAPWPNLPMLGSELIAFGFFTGMLRQKYKLPLDISLVSSMILGRIVGAGVLALVLAPPNFQVFGGLVIGNLITGLPGIAIQLALIPVLVRILEKAFGEMGDSAEIRSISEGIGSERIGSEGIGSEGIRSVGIRSEGIRDEGIISLKEESLDVLSLNQKAVTRAIDGIKAGEFGCALIKNNVIIHKGVGKGVTPLLELASSEEGLKKLENALVVDRIIGRAAAMLVVLGKAEYAYGLTMSKSGEEYLIANGIEVKSDRVVDAISDRTGRGICPMERSVMEIDDPVKGYEKLQETLAHLRRMSS